MWGHFGREKRVETPKNAQQCAEKGKTLHRRMQLSPICVTPLLGLHPTERQLLKAISTNELYGFVNMQTREWKDGILSKTMRDLGAVPDTHPKWILLDGDLDANWSGAAMIFREAYAIDPKSLNSKAKRRRAFEKSGGCQRIPLQCLSYTRCFHCMIGCLQTFHSHLHFWIVSNFVFFCWCKFLCRDK